MKRMLTALLFCGATLSTTTMSTSASDLDFSNQLRAINVCYTQWSTQHPSKAITDAQLVACMRAQGFRFDPNRQIKGVGSCQGKTATDHPDCYAEPPKTRANRTGQTSKCAVKRRDHPVGDRPTRQLSLQPVAIGAVVEVTKRLKPSMERVTW